MLDIWNELSDGKLNINIVMILRKERLEHLQLTVVVDSTLVESIVIAPGHHEQIYTLHHYFVKLTLGPHDF